MRSDINDVENELFRIINRMMDSHDSIGREFLENSKLMTADKIAEFIHQGIRRSDLSFLEDVYICSRNFGAKKSKSFFNVRFNDTVPLVLAVQIGNEDIFNFLLDHGCDIEAKGNCEFDNETIGWVGKRSSFKTALQYIRYNSYTCLLYKSFIINFPY